ncbi:MAG: hypothetical protein AB8B65_06730 [Kordia sp.]|uniref:hypothetical protein n=1 Tax=Kordia sp. TaxID=1965332 RepID=UPI00385FA4B9
MKKNILLFIVSIITLTSYAQDCGFKNDHSEEESNKKLAWFVKELPEQKLVISNDKNDIPTHVLKQLKCASGGFDIANPDEKYQSDCSGEDDKPSRHLKLLAKNKEYLVMSYNTYNLGISSYHIWIKYNKSGITDIWYTSTMGGMVVDSKFDILNYYKSISNQEKARTRLIKN